MSIQDLLLEGRQLLTQAGISGAHTDTELILADVLACDRSHLVAHPEEELSVAQTKRVQKLLKKRADRQPMSYVLGYKDFYGLKIAVDKRALTPRVETEIIVSEVLARAPKSARVLDIGTGSGAMAIALASHRGDLDITATDVSQDALSLAQENASHLLHPSHVKFLVSDLFGQINDSFDVIVANLPYVSPQADLMPEVSHEPDVALFGQTNDGLGLYRQFFEQLPEHLSPRGLVFLESDPWQQPELLELAQKSSLKPIFQDYFILGFKNHT